MNGPARESASQFWTNASKEFTAKGYPALAGGLRSPLSHANVFYGSMLAHPNTKRRCIQKEAGSASFAPNIQARPKHYNSQGCKSKHLFFDLSSLWGSIEDSENGLARRRIPAQVSRID